MNNTITEAIAKEMLNQAQAITLVQTPPFESWGVEPHIFLDGSELRLWLKGSKNASVNDYLDIPGFPKVKSGKSWTYPWPAIAKFLLDHNY